jgi:hypothetical protein
MFQAIRDALYRARLGIALVAATCVLSVSTGSILAHAGHAPTLAYRDSLVARAHRHDPASLANDARASGYVAVIAHRSRFRPWRSAAYLLVMLTLQLSGFTLAGGVGIRLGRASYRREAPVIGPSWFRLSLPALRDVGYIYLLITPLLALGSACEFLLPTA